MISEQPEPEVATPHGAQAVGGDIKRRAAYFAVVLVSFAPLLFFQARQLWAFEHYQFFPLLVVAIAAVCWLLSRSEPIPNPTRDIYENILVVAGLCVLLLAVIGWSPNLAMLAFAIAAGGVLQHFYRHGWISRFAPIWLLFFLLVRLPANMDVDLVFWLQGVTSNMASELLDFVGVNHVLAGHIIRIPSNAFLVEDACSGIQSLFTIVAATAVVACVIRRSWLHVAGLFMFAIFWACMINTMRVSSVVIASVWFDVDLSSGWPHELLGLILFAVALGMLVSSDYLLQFLLHADGIVDIDFSGYQRSDAFDPETTANASQIHESNEHPHENTATHAPEQFELSRSKLAIASAFAFLGVVQLAIAIASTLGAASINPDDPRMATLFNEETLPEKIGPWQRTGFETESRSNTNYLGRHSASWVYSNGDKQVFVAVDYPFLGWHELTGCYKAQGCTLQDREIVNKESDSNVVSCTVRHASGESSALLFSQYLQSGEPLLPLGNDAGSWDYWLSRIQSSFLRISASVRKNQSNYQIQLLCPDGRSDGDIDAAELLDLHQTTAARVVAGIKEAMQ